MGVDPIHAYITVVSMAVFCVSIAAAVTLFTNPQTFRVNWALKGCGYLAFVIDIAGGMTAFGWATLGWPDAFLQAALAMVLTAALWMLSVFIYVHALVIPRARGMVK